MQANTFTVSELVNRSIGGDRVALQQLLRRHATGLMQHIESQLPSSIQSVVDADDILQLTFIDAFQKIEQFKPYTAHAFDPWLRGIADLHLKDVQRMLKRIKRGGNHQQADDVLVELISLGSRTPSGSAAQHEAVDAIRNAISQLPEEYRTAMQLRAIEGKSLESIAQAMQRTPRAVQGLLDRGRKIMRQALGSLSHYQ